MFEIDFFSLDEVGNLVVTTKLGIDDTLINEKIHDFVDTLPNTSEFDRVRTGDGIFTDWDDYAKKGIIAYDDYDGDNILTSIPRTNLNVKELPIHIQELFENNNG